MNILLEKYEIGATVEFGIYGKGNVLLKKVMSQYFDPEKLALVHYEKNGELVVDYVIGEGGVMGEIRQLSERQKATQKDIEEAVQLGVRKYGALYIEKCPKCHKPAKFFFTLEGRWVALGCKDCNICSGSNNFDYKKFVDGWNKLSIENRQKG